MSPRSDYEAFEASSRENHRLLRQEELIVEVTEALATALSREGITKAQLAQRLGRSKGFVSQILAGGRNLTLRTVADVADALGHRVKVIACRRHRWNMPFDRFEMSWKGQGVIRSWGDQLPPETLASEVNEDLEGAA
jgi:transcriptional regulator with XRE-family HTH domain